MLSFKKEEVNIDWVWVNIEAERLRRHLIGYYVVVEEEISLPFEGGLDHYSRGLSFKSEAARTSRSC